MDFMTPEQRHKNMCNIKQKNTLPEQLMMRELRKRKIYFTHHCKDLPGKPDIVFKRKKIAVFIDSEFWHGKANLPKSNLEFWSKKFEYNRNHDVDVNCKLKNMGWRVIRLTDKEVKKDLENCIKIICVAIGRDETEYVKDEN